ncbi:sensor histidine kinase [Chitinophaga lutea]
MAWVCLFVFPFVVYRIRVADSSFYIKEVINTLFLVGLFYLNTYVLIPHFFTRKKIGIYILCIVGLIVFIGIQQAIVEYRFMSVMMHRGPVVSMEPAGAVSFSHAVPAGRMGKRVLYVQEEGPGGKVQHVELIGDSVELPPPMPWRKTLIRAWRNRQPQIVDSVYGFAEARAARPLHDRIFLQHFFFPEMLRKSATFALLILFMSGFIKIALEWFKSEQQREELKMANLHAELKFLKSQINPHFLFNSLNTIYSLAHRRSPETEHALVKLSTIMRYMIYQSNEDRVPLQAELRYLQDYIDIQRLRMARNIPVEVALEGETDGMEIAPMLLIPFVENAFKHGVSYKEPSFIRIRIAVSPQGQLRLIVRNRLFRQRTAEKGGVGLTNVLKRLSLLYEDAHTISVREHGEEFIADLTISLKNDEVFSS